MIRTTGRCSLSLGCFGCHAALGRYKRGRNETEVRNRSRRDDLLSWGSPGWLPVCRRSSLSSPPFNGSPTSSSLQSAMFLYTCDSKKKKKKKSIFFFGAQSESHVAEDTDSLHLLAAMWRCVSAGLKELVNELTNQLKGWSVSGLQTPAEGHQFIPEQTGGYYNCEHCLEEWEQLDNRSHLVWGKVRLRHVEAFLDHLVELSVHGNIGVRTFTCTGLRTESAAKTRKMPISTISVCLPTQGEDLPQQNSVGPDVALHCVDTLEDALWRHPLHRKSSL